MGRFLVTAALASLAPAARANVFFNSVTGHSQECMDVTLVNDPACYHHIIWAQQTGIEENISWYPKGVTTFADFQCALALKGNITGVNELGPSHNCSEVPCEYVSQNFSWHNQASMTPNTANTDMCRHMVTTVLPTTTMQTLAATLPPTTTTTTTEAPASVPGWAWAVIAAAVCGILVALAIFSTKGEKPKKKKRALKPAPAPQPLAPEPQPTVAEPLPMYQPVYTVQPPPVYTQPVVTYAAPQAVTTIQAPPQTVQMIQQVPTTMSYVGAPTTMQSMVAPAAQQVYAAPQQVYAAPQQVYSAPEQAYYAQQPVQTMSAQQPMYYQQ